MHNIFIQTLINAWFVERYQSVAHRQGGVQEFQIPEPQKT
jgi:hypothetical protein